MTVLEFHSFFPEFISEHLCEKKLLYMELNNCQFDIRPDFRIND